MRSAWGVLPIFAACSAISSQTNGNVRCPQCGEPSKPLAMKEDRPLLPLTIYGLTKMDEELETMLVGGFYQIPVVAFRYFSVYGPRQSLTNPYTGVDRTLRNESHYW